MHTSHLLNCPMLSGKDHDHKQDLKPGIHIPFSVRSDTKQNNEMVRNRFLSDSPSRPQELPPEESSNTNLTSAEVFGIRFYHHNN